MPLADDEERVRAGGAVGDGGVGVVATIDHDMDDGAGGGINSDLIVAGQAVHVRRVERGFGVHDMHRRDQPGHDRSVTAAGDGDVVGVVGGVDDDGVGWTVAGSGAEAASRSAVVSVTSVPVRSLTVMVSAPPSGVEVDVLDVVGVHGDVARCRG